MTIEAQLERIANALEAIAGNASAGSAPSPAEESTPAAAKSSGGASSKSKAKTSSKSKPKAEAPSDTPSKDEVRNALKRLQKAQDAAAARNMLKQFKAKTVTDLKEENYAALIEAVDEALDG